MELAVGAAIRNFPVSLILYFANNELLFLWMDVSGMLVPNMVMFQKATGLSGAISS